MTVIVFANEGLCVCVCVKGGKRGVGRVLRQCKPPDKRLVAVETSG